MYLYINPWAVLFVVEIEWFRVMKPFRSVYFLLLECNPWSQIFFSVLILVPLERIPRLLAEITLRTWFATFELLVIYRTAIGSAYLIVRVNLGLARFLRLLRRRQTHLLSPLSAARN